MTREKSLSSSIKASNELGIYQSSSNKPVLKNDSSSGDATAITIFPKICIEYSKPTIDESKPVRSVSLADVTIKKHPSIRSPSSMKGYSDADKASLTLPPKTPFGINRHILLFIVVVYATCIGTHFFNWTPWEKILINNKAFNHLCDETELLCPKQRAEISGLLPLASVSMFSFTFMAGLLLDIIGPKTCSIVGNCLLIAGWSLLACAPSTHCLYPIGFILIGAGCDPAFFGTLSIGNLFPGYGSTVISLLGAARSLSNLWPLLLFEIAERNEKFTFSIMAVLFVVMYVVCLSVVFLLIPQKPYTNMDTNSASSTGILSPETTVTAPTTKLPQSCVELECCLENPSQAVKNVREIIIPTAITDIPLSSGEPSGSGVSGVEAAPSLPEEASSSGSTLINRTKWEVFKYQLWRLAQHCGNALYFPVVLICIFNVVRNNYYLTTATMQLGSAEPFLAIINVLAFIPGPIMGLMVDTYGPLIGMLGINTTNTLMFTALLISEFYNNIIRDILAYCSVVLAFPGIGFLLSQIYCYVAVYFPPEDMGKLAGLASFVAGLCGLIVRPMCSFSANIKAFWPMNLVNLMFSLLTYVCIGLLMWLVSVSKRRSVAS